MRAYGWQLALLLSLLWGLAPVSWAGKLAGEVAGYNRKVGFEQRLFYVAAGNGSGQVEYVCKAFTGDSTQASTASAIWQIQKLTYDSSNRVSTIVYANGVDNFTAICDNRATLSYF